MEGKEPMPMLPTPGARDPAGDEGRGGDKGKRTAEATASESEAENDTCWLAEELVGGGKGVLPVGKAWDGWWEGEHARGSRG